MSDNHMTDTKLYTPGELFSELLRAGAISRSANKDQVLSIIGNARTKWQQEIHKIYDQGNHMEVQKR